VSEKPDGSPFRRRKATVKQKKFSGEYIAAAGNGVVAARKAGYRGNTKQLAVQACRNLKNPKVQRTIAAMVDALVEPALGHVAEAMEAEKVRFFLTKDGVVVHSQPEPDQKVRLEAIKFVFELRRTWCDNPVAAAGQQDHGQDRPAEKAVSAPPSSAMSAMAPADRIAFREAGEIEEQLAEVERELAEGDDDEGHNEDQS
jgi:hypothetical protein